MIRDIIIYASAFMGVFAVSYYLLSLLAYRKYEKFRDFLDSELPKVTVIIPAYNEEKTIKRTIESALSLEYPKEKLEIIVVDDGSKDGTYGIAKKFEGKRLKVFTKKNGGKSTAMNFAIPKAKGEIIVTMDADSYATPSALRKMVNYFTTPNVMCVTPSMAVNNPKGFWQRLQQAEYLVGIFLRKSFSTMNAIHVTPGAFSSYRKEFFEKYGGFDAKGHLTEDMEMALRIQANGYSLRCCDDAVIYTNVPDNFKDLLIQRRRWYYGWMHLLLTYRRLFSKKYGHMGMVVLPIAILSILFSVAMTFNLLFSSLNQVRKEIVFLNSVNFSFDGAFDLSFFAIERFFYYFFSKPTTIILVIFLGIVTFYMVFAKRRVKHYSNVLVGMPLFILFYSFLLTISWVTAAVYYFIIGKISWGKR